MRIGREVRRLRGKRSAQHIADRTRDLGYPIGRATISELETGRRRSITVPELLVLAAALDVPPMMLLCPGLPDGTLEVLPGLEVSAAVAAEWFEGSDEAVQLRFDDTDDVVAATMRDDMQAIRKFTRLRRQLTRLEMLLQLKDSGVEYLQGREISRDAVSDIRAELDAVAALLRGRGYTVRRAMNEDQADGDD